MANRIWMDGSKLLIAKPGYDVKSGSLTDDQKQFDSRWSFSSMLLHSGYHGSSNASTPSATVTYPDVGHVPFLHLSIGNPETGYVNQEMSNSGWVTGGGNVRSIVTDMQVTSTGFTLNWKDYDDGLGGTGYYFVHFYWYIFAVSD